jgi:antitoxin ParD1/3/4
MPTRNINLTDYYDRFIERSVAGGKYQNASEMVREALRLLEQRQEEEAARLERLRTAAKIGFDAIDRGDYRDVDVRGLSAHVRSIGGQSTLQRKRNRSRTR